MANSSTIQINISLYMFLAQFLLKKKTFFLSASALIFFPEKRRDMDELLINSTTRPKPLTCTGINLVPRDNVFDNEAKPLKKPSGGANLQSSQKIWISGACETKLGCVLSFSGTQKLGCVLSFLENAIIIEHHAPFDQGLKRT